MYLQILGVCSAKSLNTPHVLNCFLTAEPNFLWVHCWEQILGPECQKVQQTLLNKEQDIQKANRMY